MQLDSQKYQPLAESLFRQAIDAAGIGGGNPGGLRDSLTITREERENGFSYIISFNSYGLFLDAGVKGIKSQSKAPGSPFSFKSLGIFKANPPGLTDAQKGAIAWYGIKPYPWVENFLNSLGERIPELVGKDVFDSLEEQFNPLEKTVQLKITL